MDADNKGRIADIVTHALVYECKEPVREQVVKALANIEDDAVFRHFVLLELISDMVTSISGNLVKRLYPHVSRGIMVSELDAALHDWEIMVNLYYRPKYIRELGSDGEEVNPNDNLLRAVETVKDYGKEVLMDICDKAETEGIGTDGDGDGYPGSVGGV